MLVRAGLDRRFATLVAKPPATLVRRLMQRDAVDPGLETRVGIEPSDPAKDLDEYFLGRIGCVGGIVNYPVDQAVNRLAVLSEKPGKSLFGSGLQFGHDRGFFRAESYRTGQVTQRRCSRHGTHGAVLIIVIFWVPNKLYNRPRCCRTHRPSRFEFLQRRT